MTASECSPELWNCPLGTVPYREAMAIQANVCARRQADELPDVLLLLEHPPTYTRGRRSADGELPMGDAAYRAKGIDVVGTDRGGKVTYHGPGQLVGYAIVRVDDVLAHVRTLEDTIVASLADEGVSAHSRASEGPDFTGVWVEDRKIASIGIHVSRGVATHGFAVNVNNDLTPFSWIVPCGLEGVQMTSIAHEQSALPHAQDALAHADDERLFAAFQRGVGEHLCASLARRGRLVGAEALGLPERGVRKTAAAVAA
jgi:lipoyl(octanoyl) transferase